ncbi:formylglycine-generating enzyme family protein [Paludisphaera mucosa]|uniref:SUMF1/EgtB/PvdO family nonheme iron enzyme n=1 Tax=Paludisphaera mucosa TaxID=3030827 RepID=A0ABT6FCD7_9BACT|nr:SUMF1/EgtB/PvdO family nonheme iron enzyme [Paludisphaera mucosa]MDG3005211.1 SUMF1/EgtB/PvdO family nonheme iron enzyme [Paludisphaera mucosa]
MDRREVIRRSVAIGLIVAASSAAVEAQEPSGRPHAGYTEAIPDSAVRFDMVAIPGGTFAIGSPSGEAGRGGDEGPRRSVTIRPFWMGRAEVTWDEYAEFRKGGNISNRTNAEALAKDADAVTRPTPPYPDETRGYGREGYPAIGVSHHAAMEYCHWLSKKTGKIYRLPTEAEWEYACRAGTNTIYFFGDDPKELARFAWFDDGANETPQPVGRKAANPWGLHDIVGNASEWCLDRYVAEAYARLPEDRPSVGPVILLKEAPHPHVARGGSWADPAAACRSASRRGSDATWNQMDPDGSIRWVWDADFVGFRVVRAVDEQEDLKGVRSLVTRRRR